MKASAGPVRALQRRSYDTSAMVARPQLDEELNSLKVESIQANLEAAIDFAKLALLDDQAEVIGYRQKTCDAYDLDSS